MMREIYKNWISPQCWLERAGVRAPMQIVIGLVLLTACVLLIAGDLKLLPDRDEELLRARARLAEMASREVALAASENDINEFRDVLRGLVGRDGVLSACVRKRNGAVVAETPGHDKYWSGGDEAENTLTHIHVVLRIDGKPKGQLEIAFSDPHAGANWHEWWASPTIQLITFLLGTEFILYWLFLSRMLTMLDPSGVVPNRMQLLMDTLVEGLIVLDDQENIVMTNQSFAQTAFLSTEQLIGRKLSSLPWTALDGDGSPEILPWEASQASDLQQRGVPMRLRISAHHGRRLKVNVSPIFGPDGKRRGALITFDDQTVIEKDNLELTQLLTRFGNMDEQIQTIRQQLTSKANPGDFEALDELAKVACEMAQLCRSVTLEEKPTSSMSNVDEPRTFQESK